MERYELTKESDRLALAERIFSYPSTAHVRKHGPRGYTDYESYREWLRDEFSFRCVFSLARETWVGLKGNFDIDHLKPRTSSPDLTCEYDNLLYLTHPLNLVRGKHPVPDPCQIPLGQCLRVQTRGDHIGYIETLNDVGQRIERIFRLNNDDAVAFRKQWLRIMRSVAVTDEGLFRSLIGYPTNLPDLRRKKKKNENTRKDGLKVCALVLRELGELPEWY